MFDRESLIQIGLYKILVRDLPKLYPLYWAALTPPAIPVHPDILLHFSIERMHNPCYIIYQLTLDAFSFSFWLFKAKNISRKELLIFLPVETNLLHTKHNQRQWAPLWAGPAASLALLKGLGWVTVRPPLWPRASCRPDYTESTVMPSMWAPKLQRAKKGTGPHRSSHGWKPGIRTDRKTYKLEKSF